MTRVDVWEAEDGFRILTSEERTIAPRLLYEAGVIIDAYNSNASEEAKTVVACRMVRRLLGNGESSVPIGATQGSETALGYSQSWTVSGGAIGELYLSKLDKRLLGVGNAIGAHSPIEEMAAHD